MDSQAALLLLDCHPTTHSVHVVDSGNPDCTVWTCFVEATLEYCRIVFDVFGHIPVSVHAAGVPVGRNVLNSWKNFDISQIADNFRCISPEAVAPSPGRLSLAFEDALRSLNDEQQPRRNVRIVLIVIAKTGEETGFIYRETPDPGTVKKDLRDIIEAAFQRTWVGEKKPPFDHCHIDILRVIPPRVQLPSDVQRAKVMRDVTAAVYNVAPVRGALTNATRHLAQMHYRLNEVRLVGVPMKKTASKTSISYDIDILFHAGKHVRFGSVSFQSGWRIYDREFLSDRRTPIRWCKRTSQTPDIMMTECVHAITPRDISESPAWVLVQNLMSGSFHFFADFPPDGSISDPDDPLPPPNKASHCIASHNGTMYMQCLPLSALGTNTSIGDLMERPIPRGVRQSPLMQPLAPSVVQDFLHFIVMPNLFDRLQKPHGVFGLADNSREAFDITELNTSYDDEIGRPSDPIVKGLHWLNLETRWWKGLLTGSGDIGAKLINGLSQKPKAPVFEELQQLKVLLCSEDLPADYVTTISEILDGLLKRARGVSSSFESQKTARVVLKQIRTLGEVFKTLSPGHADLSQLINTRIKPDGTENKQQVQSDGSSSQMSAVASPVVTSPTIVTKPEDRTVMAWQQVEQYRNMTLREQEDLQLQSFQPAVQPQASSQAHATSNATVVRPSTGRPLERFHPYAAPSQQTSKRAVQPRPGRLRAWEGPVLVPYLKVSPPNSRDVLEEREKYENRLGTKPSLFRHYWAARRLELDIAGRKRPLFDGLTSPVKHE